MNRVVSRLGLTAFAIVAGSSVAFAQDATTGAIIGTVRSNQGAPIANAQVTIEGERGQFTLVTDQTGTFRASSLIPGRYFISISAQGFQSTSKTSVMVSLGQRSPVSFSLPPATDATVVITGTAIAIDTGKVTDGTSFGREEFSSIPLGRSFVAVATMAPGVVDGGGTGAANPSIGGGTGLENQYVIDGANTTNPGFGGNGSYSQVYGSLGTGINSDFIEEVQVKSFGLEAEWGQTTGGVINAITRSGTNDFKGEVFAYLDINGLQAKSKTNGNLVGVASPSFDSSSRTELGFLVQGPIIKDKLFYFVGYNPVEREVKRTAPADDGFGNANLIAGQQFTQKTRNDSYYLKLQWQINANHLLEASLFGDPGKRKFGPQSSGDFYIPVTALGNPTPDAKFSDLKFGTNTQTLKYNGTYFNDMFVEARATHVENTFERHLGPQGDSSWFVTDTATGTPLSLGLGFYEAKLKGQNDQFDLKVSKTWGNFDLKAGYLHEEVKFDSTNRRSGPTGFLDTHVSPLNTGTPFTTGLSIQQRYYLATPGDPSTQTPYYRIVRALTSPDTRHTKTLYDAAFVQGTYRWDAFTFKAGFRLEGQELKGTELTYKFKMGDNLSPRLGVTWDFEGDGKSKAYLFYGRYFEKIPLDIAVRALSTEKGVNRSDWYNINSSYTSLSNPIQNGVSIDDYNPNTGAETTVTSHFRVTGSQPTVILPNTKSMYQDEFVGGIDHEFKSGMTMSNRIIYRRLGRIIEDISLDGDSYFIGNPGQNTNEIRDITGFTGAATFPDPVRRYYAFESELRKQTSKYSFFMNIRLSRLEGNYEGLFRNDNGQDDPNISSLYDLPVELLADPARGLTGREQFLVGSLPTDRTVVANIGGSYTWDMGLTVGALFRAQTGTPITTYLAHPVYENAGEIPEYGRGVEGRLPSTYNLDVSAQYLWKITNRYKLTFMANVFNIFNAQQFTALDTNADQGLGTTNPNYMQPVAYQAARQIRLGAKFSF